jgi:hypothetical protein
MQEPGITDPRDRGLLESLQQLQPAPLQTTKEQIWYRAGLEAGRSRIRIWKALTATMTVAIVSIIFIRPAPPAKTEHPNLAQSVPAQVPVESPEERASAAAYYRLRDAVARDGLAGLGRDEPQDRGSAPPAAQRWPFEF